jgi:hypothetical protein
MDGVYAVVEVAQYITNSEKKQTKSDPVHSVALGYKGRKSIQMGMWWATLLFGPALCYYLGLLCDS